MKLGVLPAAGVGNRWGTFPKFLLPCGDREWLLDRAVRGFPAEQVIVVFGDQTRNDLFNHLERCCLLERVVFAKNRHMEYDFWGSMLAALQFEADYYYFAMPDTYLSTHVFGEMPLDGISLGMHYTLTPERFGVMRNGKIVNKSQGEPGWAWGCLGWDKNVRDLWLSAHLETYTDAINLALQECKSTQLPLTYYYDMASWKDYVDFVGRQK